MKIIFVRHGHPNYKDDCLTELGHPQAEAAAERLKNEKIDKIFSSSCGRAFETAEHIAARHNLQITQLDFMREIHWGVPGTDDFIHPWDNVDAWVQNGKDMITCDWRSDPEYKDRTVLKSYNKVVDGFDLVPNVDECFADGVHPNAYGSVHLANNIKKILKK